MSKTILLSKRLTAFLSQSATPQLQTLLLLSPTGNLLCSSSPAPASTLRTQATLACSLWNLYYPFNNNTSSPASLSLPPSPTAHEICDSEKDLSCITIQLEYGIMYVRALSSGLLFVAIGPSNVFPSHLNMPRHIGSTYTSPLLSPAPHDGDAYGTMATLHTEGVISAPRSEASSVGTERGTNTSLWGVRKRATEVSQLLEGRLEGFVLGSRDTR